MLFMISGRDRPGNIAGRLQHRDAHRAHYTGLGPDLILAGPYLDEDGEPIGSMIIIRAENESAAQAHAKSDPYWRNDVFAEMSVWRWDWFMNRPDNLES